MNDAIVDGIFTGFGFMADAVGVIYAENPLAVIFLGALILAGLLIPSRRTRRRR